MPLSEWQAAFFAERVATAASGREGVYFREQVFGALDVLTDALPELEEALCEQNFRFFVRELLAATQPTDAMAISLIDSFLSFLANREELSGLASVQRLIREA